MFIFIWYVPRGAQISLHHASVVMQRDLSHIVVPVWPPFCLNAAQRMPRWFPNGAQISLHHASVVMQRDLFHIVARFWAPFCPNAAQRMPIWFQNLAASRQCCDAARFGPHCGLGPWDPGSWVLDLGPWVLGPGPMGPGVRYIYIYIYMSIAKSQFQKKRTN
jgi:hypothetical protein